MKPNSYCKMGAATLLSSLAFGFSVSADDSAPALPVPELGLLVEAKVDTRTPLDFSTREPFREEHVYTHYFPVRTWQPAIAAFREDLGEREDGDRNAPRLFRDLPRQLQQLDSVPIDLQIDVAEQAAGFIDPNSDSHIHLDELSRGRSHASGPGYIRELSHELLNLLVAWKVTGEEQYRDFAIGMVEAMQVEFPLDLFTESTASSSGPDVDPHGGAELLKPLAIAYDLLRGEMDETRHLALAQRVSEYIEVQLKRTRASYAAWGSGRAESNWWVPNHNWTAMISGSMGLAALAIEGDLEDFDPMPALWTAYSTVEMWFDKGFEPGGGYLEGNHYVLLGLGFAMPFAEALAVRGGPDLYQHPHLQEALSYIASEMLPENPPQRLNAWNRSGYQPLRWDYSILMLAGVLDQSVGLWIWEEAGAEQSRPLHPLSVLYYPVGMEAVHPTEAGYDPETFYLRRGLVNWRTGWEPDDFFFSFSSGPVFPTMHGQSDENTFHLYAYGEMLAVDSGAAGYDTESKSGILINGQGQARSSGARSVDGFIPAYGKGTAYSYVMGDAKSAYDENNRGEPGVSVGRADRHVIYVKGDTGTSSPSVDAPPYVIFYDDIQHDRRQNEYTWLLITNPGNTLETEPSQVANEGDESLYARVIGRGGNGHAGIHFLYPHELDVRSDRWQRNPRLRVSTQAVNPHFLSILFPYRDEWKDDLPSLRRLDVNGFAAGVMEGEGFTDFIGSSLESEIETGSIRTDAQLLHVRFEGNSESPDGAANGIPSSWIAIGASYLEIDGVELFEHHRPVSLQYHDGTFSPVKFNPEHARD